MRVQDRGSSRVPTERGASSVEYALVLVGIAAILVLAIFALGPVVREMFDDTCDQVQDARSNASVECATGN